MKKLISTILAVAMIVTMFAAMPAFAASSYDASSNAYSINFNTVGEVGNAANYTLEAEGNYSYKFDYSADPAVSTVLTLGSANAPLIPDSKKIKASVEVKFPDDKSTNRYLRMFNFNLGGIETGSLIGTYLGTDGSVRLGPKGSRGNDYDTGGGFLWANIFGKWLKFTFILDLENGTYDVYMKCDALTRTSYNLPLLDTSNNVIKNVSGLNSFSVYADNSMSSLWGNQAIAKTFFIDNFSASDITTSGYFGFEEANDIGISGVIESKSGYASVVETTGKDGNPTKALSIKYDGLGKYYVNGVATPSNVTTQSNYEVKDSNGLVKGEKIMLGFDFKIDGEYSIAGTYNSRSAYAFPTFFSLATGGGETTPIVGAKYTRANGDPGFKEGNDTWEIVFTDGRLNWVGSGVELNRDQWATIDLDLNLAAGTYDAYVNDVLVKEDLKIGHVTSSGSVITGTNLNSFKIAAGTVSHYNANNACTWGAYIDNIYYGVPADKKAVSASSAALIKADDSAAADGEARKYTATIYNPNAIGEYTYFAMRAVDANGEMKDLVLDKVHIPAGRSTFTKEFKKIDAGNYGVKAFFFDLDTLKPYNNGMGAASSAIAE